MHSEKYYNACSPCQSLKSRITWNTFPWNKIGIARCYEASTCMHKYVY